MSRSCESCMNSLVWDNRKKRYVCVTCENSGVFDPFESNLNTQNYIK